jgi:hypothetical protein
MNVDNQNKPKWYFNNWSLIISFLCVGPFVLPLVWFNPRFSKKAKVFITLIVIFLVYLVTYLFIKSLQYIVSYYQQLLGS